MHISIIRAIVNALSFTFVSLTSMFNLYQANSVVIGINNADRTKSSTIINTVVNYNTIYKYNSHVPTGIVNVINEGVDGIIYQDMNGNVTKTLVEKQDKIIEIGTGMIGEYVGVVTGYGPDCATCDGRGYVACPTKDGKWTNLITDGNFYEDPYYGTLQILAADFRQFPCGTIIEVTNKYLDKPILGIVLDTGSAMRNAYNNGYVHIDVAFKTEEGLAFATDNKTKFSVKRWGW